MILNFCYIVFTLSLSLFLVYIFSDLKSINHCFTAYFSSIIELKEKINLISFKENIKLEKQLNNVALNGLYLLINSFKFSIPYLFSLIVLFFLLEDYDPNVILFLSLLPYLKLLKFNL